MKKIMDRLSEIMSRPKFEKLFIIALPFTAVIIAVLMLTPQLMSFVDEMDKAYIAAYASPTPVVEMRSAPTPRPTVTPTPSPSPSPSPTPQLKTATKLDASSIQNDMYVRILDAEGKPIAREGLGLHVDYPGGESYDFPSHTDGSFYIVGLYPGEYSISMLAHEDYETAEPIICTVKEQVEYKPIDNISDIVIVQDVSEIYTEELTYTDIPAQLVPEIIITPEEVQGENSVIVEEKPIVDANGKQTYSYEFKTGPNGFLLKKGSSEESNVLPVDENGDGKPEYGLYEEREGYFVSVILYNSDNSPVEDYEVTASPLVETTETPVGWQSIDGNMYYYDSNGSPVKGLKEIDGRLYYFDQFGIRASQLGIDVSYYNEDINWQAVKANGIDFAIIRIGGRTWEKGNLYFDTRFKEYLSGAKNAGIKVGVYFYSTAINEVEAVQEASVTLELLNGASLDLPVFIDMEYSGMYPDARMDKLTIEERSLISNAFCQTIISSGYQAGVYSGQYYYEQAMDYNAIRDYTVWLASYTKDNKLPSFKNRYDIWQFSDSGKVSGIQGGVDMNVIF